MHKETKHVETTGTKFNKSSEMETLFVALSLNVRRGPSEEILPVSRVHQGFTGAGGSPS